METTLKNLSTYIDVNSAVGTPISTKEGDLIIPLSKVTFGLLAGGGEYGKTNIFKKGEDLPFSAGNGAIVSLKPCGFLIKNAKGEFKVLAGGESSYEFLIDKAGDFLTKLKENE
jgi:sporulation protein YtfJ